MKTNIIALLMILTPLISNAEEGRVYGPQVPLGNGSASLFVNYKNDGTISNLGIELTGEALSNLPTMDTAFELSLPEGTNISPFDHVVMNWNPAGHVPTEIYGVPHFDFHFYLISSAQQNAITCQGDDAAICMKNPSAEFIPPYYAPSPEGVPMMGWHWFDTTSGEFNGLPFTKTYIYGYYNGEIAFLEPMVALSYLLEKDNVTTVVQRPEKFSKEGAYPSTYTVMFNSVKDAYHIVLENFE